MNDLFLVSPDTVKSFALSVMVLGAIAILVAGVFTVLTLFLLLPGCFLREALQRGNENAAEKAKAWRKSLTNSRALGFARRLMKHDWTALEVVVCSVFLVTLAAGVLAVLVAGYVLGLSRPTVADQILPWLLGASVAISMSWAWAQRKVEPWLAVTILACGMVSLVFIALLKVEATVINPAEYVHHHPLKDRLLAPTWVAVEIGAFAGSALAHDGYGAALRVLAALVGLLIEVAVALLFCAVWIGEFVLRGVLVGVRLVLGALLIPAELVYGTIRRRVGTDLDGNYYLPPPSGGALPEHGNALLLRPPSREENPKSTKRITRTATKEVRK